jgi:hypothetical protein
MCSGLNVTAFFMIYLWVPETKQRTLEELDYIFAVPTRKHMSYQCFKVLPWWTQRYILRRDVKLEPLYKLDLAARDEKVASREGSGPIVSTNTEM